MVKGITAWRQGGVRAQGRGGMGQVELRWLKGKYWAPRAPVKGGDLVSWNWRRGLEDTEAEEPTGRGGMEWEPGKGRGA